MKLIRIPRSKIKLGQPLPWNVRDETTRLLLSRGHVVEDEHLLDALVTRGVFVDLEEARAVAHEESQAAKDSMSVSTLKRPTNLFSQWDRSAEDLHKLMGQVPKTPLQLTQLTEFTHWLTELVDQDVDVAIYHVVRQESAHAFYYGYNHAIHTAVLCLLMARHLNWPQPRILSLVQAALTMNLPILHLQGEMANQEEPLREGQRTQIRAHPMQAVQWLTQAGVSDADWLTAIAQHHERADGSGYPEGRTDVADIAVALRVADVFMSKISRRKLRAALPIQEATKQLFHEDHGGPLSNAVIKELGLFPPGDLVKLASGEIGVVARRTANVKCPVVATLTDESGKPIVRTQRRNTSEPTYTITGTVADKTLVAHLPPERIYGYANQTAPGAVSAAPEANAKP